MFQKFEKFPFCDIGNSERGKENTLSTNGRHMDKWRRAASSEFQTFDNGALFLLASSPNFPVSDNERPADHDWVAVAEKAKLLGRSAKDLDLAHAVY